MSQHDVIVIGAGPGGYVAAIKAAQAGFNTACVEKEPALGGTCLRVGCIPSKALLESSERFAVAREDLAVHGVEVGDVQLDLKKMLQRKDKVVDSLTQGVASLFKKYGVTRYQGAAKFDKPGRITVTGGDDKREELTASHIIIATGSTTATIPGVEWNGDRIGSSTEALSYPAAPEHLVVIGAGYIGLELGSVWKRLGSKVTVLEYLDRVLPGMDTELAKQAHKLFKRQGLKFQLSCKVTGAKTKGKGGKKCVVEIEDGDPVECDRVLVAVGRKPNTENLGLDEVGVKLDDRGRVQVDEHFQTSVEGVYAIGDVIRGPMLAHKAEEEGAAVVEYLKGGYCHVNYGAIPAVVYTHPEIASVGQTEDELQDQQIEYNKGVFHFRGNGRARALNEIDGLCKVLADKQTDRILGVHIIGARAGDMIAEAAVAIEFGATSEDIARSSHAHPTLAEVIKEAALAVTGSPVHA